MINKRRQKDKSGIKQVNGPPESLGLLRKSQIKACGRPSGGRMTT